MLDPFSIAILAFLAGQNQRNKGAGPAAPATPTAPGPLAASAPSHPAQAPFPSNAPLPGGPAALPPVSTAPAPVAKKKAVEVWKAGASLQTMTPDAAIKQYPAGWVPAHPPSSIEVQKAVALLPGWQLGRTNFDRTNNTTAGIRAYRYTQH